MGYHEDEDTAQLGGGMYEDSKAPILEIPLRDDNRFETSEVVGFDPFHLPHVDAVVDVLVDQEAAQHVWLRFASAYFRANRPAASEKILMTLKGEYQTYRSGGGGGNGRFNPDRTYQNDLEGRCLVGNSLAWLYIFFAKEQRLSRLQGGGGGISSNFETKTVSILNPDLASTSQVLIPQLLAKAEALLNQAEKFSKAERAASVTWINRAELAQEQLNLKLATMKQLSQPEIDRALTTMDKDYQTSLEYRNVGMRALFGRANILFQRAQFKEAKDMYTRGIAKYPGADPGPTRVALGLCFYELGQEGRAQECFERALELDPKSVDAQVCLAILESGLASEAERKPGATAKEVAQNQLEAKRLRERVSDRLRLAYESDKFNPLLQVHLANDFFFSSTSTTSTTSREFKRVGDLAKDAFNHTSQKKIQAEACYISARNYHAQGDTKSAASLYAKCLDCWPTFPLARYGHAQMELTQTKPDLGAALRAIQQVVETVEDDEDCLLMVGSLHAKMHSNEAALQALRRVTEKNPHRVEAWLSQALLEQSKYRQSMGSAEEALRCYDKALAALRHNKQSVPYELYNNVGALRFRAGEYEKALQAFDQALELRQGSKPSDTATLQFNRARALERLGYFSQAETTYLKLISDFSPEVHYEAHMRLASMAADRGDYTTALDVHLKPLIKSTSNADFLCLYAKLELESSQSQFVHASAEAKLKRLLEGSHHDPFARLMLANQAFSVAQTGDTAALSTALGIYRTVLKMNPTNMFAANGIGASQALRGRFEAARLILDKVREFADSSCPSVWVNLAHVYMHEGSFDQAASLYDQCLKRFHDNRDAEVSLYVANALFHGQKFHEARVALIQALQHAPHDDALWFASATVDEAEAYERLSLDPKLRSVKTVEAAKRALERALGVYKWIATSKKQSAQPSNALSVDQVAKQEFAASQALGGVPHRPRAPFGSLQSAPSSPPSEALLAMARVTLAELQGQAPSQEDVEHMRQFQLAKREQLGASAEQFREQGRRPDADRALPSVSSKLAFYSSKRVDQVQQALSKSAVDLAAQIRLENKQHEVRRKLELQQRTEEEEKRAKLEAMMQSKAQKRREEEAQERRLAEVNAELAKAWQDEEMAASKAASSSQRKSARMRKKSSKMKEAEEASKVQKFSDEDKSSSSSSSSSSSDEEEEEGGETEGDVGPSEAAQLSAPELHTEDEELVFQECERIFVEEGEGVAERDGAWFKNKLREAVGEDLMGKLDSKFVSQQVAYLFSRKRRSEEMQSAATSGDGEEEEEATVAPKKRTKIIQSDSEDEL
ncbi:hypothetical protein BASA81_014031 [Batrachochytrium salamandrivorans]|nr:hypothetical protein BASA81_014031 [Batrachochytrium salamandrivorans]